MEQHKGYKFRLYPTDAQKVLLEKHFGCVRLIYNLALETKLMAYSGQKVTLSKYDLSKQLTDLKQEYPWLKEIAIGALQAPIFQLDIAFKNFYKNIAKFPTFKSKRDKNSFVSTNCIYIKGDKICVPKFQDGIKFIQHRQIEGTIKSTSITKTTTGKYYVSMAVKTNIEPLPKNDKSVGIDLGIKTFAVLSDGIQFESPKFLRQSLDRLKVLQRRYAKKQKGSANKNKASLKISLLHERIYNQRKHFLHSASNQITNDYDTICVEDLAIRNMVKNHNLALSISDASWSEFIRQLTYKAQWKNRELITIGRFVPSSKTCSNCGNIKDMPLSERTYSCECGLVLDRDVNASRNIRNAGILRTEVSVDLLPLGKTVKQKTSRQLNYDS